jgi:hypothetical protein
VGCESKATQTEIHVPPTPSKSARERHRKAFLRNSKGVQTENHVDPAKALPGGSGRISPEMGGDAQILQDPLSYSEPLVGSEADTVSPLAPPVPNNSSEPPAAICSNEAAASGRPGGKTRASEGAGDSEGVTAGLLAESETCSDGKADAMVTCEKKRTSGEEEEGNEASGLKPLAAFAQQLLGAGILSKVDARGQPANSMARYEAVSDLLSQVADSRELQASSYRGQAYDADYVCTVDDFRGEVLLPVGVDELPEHNMIVLVMGGAHYSLIIVDVYDKTVHVFDTACHMSDKTVRRMVNAVFPELALSLGCEHGFRLSNHTGRLHQYGVTCGPWTVWLAFAYIFDYRACRSSVEPGALDYAVLQADPIEFWQEVVY